MNRRKLSGVACFLLLLGCSVLVQSAWAQRPAPAKKQKDKDQQAQEKERLRQLRMADTTLNGKISTLKFGQLKRVFETGALGGDQQRQALRQMFDLHLQRMQLPYNYQNERLVTRAVQPLLNTLRELGEKNNSTAHQEAVAHLLARLPALVEKKDAPMAVRYNAVLLIGLLNQRESQDNQPPVPLPEALPVLLDIVSDAQKHPPVIRIGALVGVVRHTRYGSVSDPQLAARLLRTLLQVLEKGWPELESSPAVNTWIRIRAAEGLGNLRRTNILGSQGHPVVEQLFQVAANTKEDLALRIAALEALGRLDLSQVQGFNPELPARVGIELIHRSISREVPLELMRRQIQADVGRLLLVLWGNDGKGGLLAQVQKEEARKNLAEAVQALQRVRNVLAQRVPKDRRNPEQEKVLQEEFYEKLKSDLEAEAEGLKAWLEKNPVQGKLLQGG